MPRLERILIAGALAAAACSGTENGGHRVRPLPTPDGLPALRGDQTPRSARAASYTIDAHLDAVRHQITATQTLRWTNTGASTVDYLPFHLYLNAFKNEQSLFMTSSHGSMRGAQASASNWGWIELESVQIAGVELGKTLRHPADQGADETVVELPLPAPLAPGETIAVDFKFVDQLPEVFARTGFEDEFHMIGQWFPKVGVRVGPAGAETWECRPFHSNSEFFADFGTYDVTLTAPATEVVVATGVLVAATEAPGGTRTYTYRAEDVHDFAWMADPYMEMIHGPASVDGGTVDVRVVYRPAQADFAHRHLAAAIGTIETMSKLYVPYPWRVMTVIDPPMNAVEGAGGMEYPTLVTTSGDSALARPGLRLPEYVTVHEIGHNWFQGMLASNEPVEAWLDEGVNEWADARVMTALYGARASGIDWRGWQAEIAALRRAIAEDPESLPSPIASAAFAFVDSATYAEATYSSTLRALSTLQGTYGAARLDAAVKAYAQAWAFKHPTGRDFFAALQAGLGEDLTWFIDPVFERVGGMHLQLLEAACREQHAARGVFGQGPGRRTIGTGEAPLTGAYVCDVVVANTGTVHVPLDVELEFADGSTQRVHWDDRGTGAWQRFTVERSSQLTVVTLDPDRKVALASPVTLRYRLAGDGAASLRAAAWGASGVQTLMQVVGL